MEYKAYCVKCKEKVDIINPVKVEIKTKKGVKNAVKGTCIKCGTKVNVFIKRE